nr:putative protein [Melanopsichium pennsylvanicum 4]
MRARMQSLSTPSAASSLAVTTGFSWPIEHDTSNDSRSSLLVEREECLSPSPPASESSFAAPASQTPTTEASDSSAGSYTHDASRKSYTFENRFDQVRPSLTFKRVLSEGDIMLPQPSKKSRLAQNTVSRKRSIGLPSLANSAFGSTRLSHLDVRAPSVASWRMARNQQRDRQLAKSYQAQVSSSPTFASSRSRRKGPRSTSSRATTHAPLTQVSAGKTDVLPELRLLSATRTAPIGWSRFAGASSFAPVELYDEREAKRAPDHQRFWPIVDHQLDYTGARMLFLSNVDRKPKPQLVCDDSLSPRSGLPPHPDQSRLLSFSHPPARAASSQGLGSSDEEHSPLTPGAPSRTAARTPSRREVSRHARDAVDNESHRKASIFLPPSATLACVIDFTRAQAARKTVEAQRPSPKIKAEQPFAPLRIAPKKQNGNGDKRRDYFDHWEAYLCNFGKETTF